MERYVLDGQVVDSVELKCLVVSRGLKVGKEVYRAYSPTHRLSKSPLCCNCFRLPGGTVVQLTDMGFHLQYLFGALSWDNLKLLRYASDLGTPFTLEMEDGQAVLRHKGETVTPVTFPEKSDFYRLKTSGGLPFMGNAVLQGVDWVAFQCLWPCEYGAAGKPCQFCFSGGECEALAKKGKALPTAVKAQDVAEVVAYALQRDGVNSVQITGGSTFKGEREAGYLRGYLEALREIPGGIPGELLLYITPPEDLGLIDEYFALGASRVACSLEVWDEDAAREITPGKMEFTGRERHLKALTYIAEKYGPGKAFSNFIIGLEDFETLAAGAEALAERGVLPTASIWMPMGRPVRGSMKAPEVEYYRRVKERFAELYEKHRLEPADCCGLNVCMERDIWNYAQGK